MLLQGRGIRFRLTRLWSRTRTLAELGWLLFLRDFRARFRQTFLGSVWAVGQQLISYMPMVLVGGQLGLGGDKDPGAYAMHSLFGLLIWQMFWDGLFSAQWIGRRMRGVLAEKPFPSESILVAGTSQAVFNGAIYVAVMVAAWVVLRRMPPASFLIGVLSLPLVVVAGLAVGIFVVPLTFVYLDFRYALPFLAPLLMWSAPILYDTPESGPLRWVNEANPLTYLVNVPRDWLTVGWQLEELAFPAIVAISFALLALGLRFYRHAMPRAMECLPRR
jgi:lipopolysaccharide transport system permease protein